MTFNKDAYKSVNFKKIYSKANEHLVLSRSITSFPFKTKSFINEFSDVRLCSYKKAKDKYDISIRLFGSESAVIIEKDGAYVIFYNQSEPDYRVRFSIIHEYAHYIFGHQLNLQNTDTLYHTQEIEANCFAAQLLMPEQILRECQKRGIRLSLDFIIKSFGVSDEAAEKRLNTLANTIYEWRSREEIEYDDIILNKYAQKLNEIAPKSLEYDYFDPEADYDRQRERDSWFDSRSRWK